MADGNVRNTKSGEARFVNCRRVENFVDNSVAPTTLNGGVLEDFTDGVARFSGPDGAFLRYGTTVNGGTILRPYSGRLQVRVLSGSAGQVQIDINDVENTQISTDLLSNWTDIGTEGAFRPYKPQYRFLDVQLNDADDIVIEVRNVQIEDVSGQANMTPSEYVSLGMGDDHGANVDGVKYFNTTNGNTLVAGILTDLPGTRLTGDTGLLLEDTSANWLINTDSFSGWVLKDATQSEDKTRFGPTGYPVQSLTRINGAITHQLYLLRTPAQMGSPSNGDRAVISGFVKIINAPQGVGFFLYSSAGNPAYLVIHDDHTVTMSYGDWFDYQVLDDGWIWVAAAGEFNDSSLNHNLYVDDNGRADDDGTVFAEVAGLQLEVMTDAARGTYASSYIPCASASVVRDVEKLKHQMVPARTDSTVVMRFNYLAASISTRLFGTQDNRSTNQEIRTSSGNWAFDFYPEGGFYYRMGDVDVANSPGFNNYVFSANQVDPSNVNARILFNEVSKLDELHAFVLDHSNLDIIETHSWSNTNGYPAICKYIAVYNQAMTDGELIQASEKASLLAPPLVPTQHGS